MSWKGGCNSYNKIKGRQHIFCFPVKQKKGERRRRRKKEWNRKTNGREIGTSHVSCVLFTGKPILNKSKHKFILFIWISWTSILSPQSCQSTSQNSLSLSFLPPRPLISWYITWTTIVIHNSYFWDSACRSSITFVESESKYHLIELFANVCLGN